MGINELGLIVMACVLVGGIGLVAWNNRSFLRAWFEQHHWHWPHFH